MSRAASSGAIIAPDQPDYLTHTAWSNLFVLSGPDRTLMARM
jgi:hypothetical protein